jgi:hypothetical protein
MFVPCGVKNKEKFQAISFTSHPIRKNVSVTFEACGFPISYLEFLS